MHSSGRNQSITINPERRSSPQEEHFIKGLFAIVVMGQGQDLLCFFHKIKLNQHGGLIARHPAENLRQPVQLLDEVVDIAKNSEAYSDATSSMSTSPPSDRLKKISNLPKSFLTLASIICSPSASDCMGR